MSTVLMYLILVGIYYCMPKIEGPQGCCFYQIGKYFCLLIVENNKPWFIQLQCDSLYLCLRTKH